MTGIWGMISLNDLEFDLDLTDGLHKEKSVSHLKSYKRFKNSAFGRLSVNKFHNDKIFMDIGDKLICNDGVILNLKDLLIGSESKGLGEYISNCYDKMDLRFAKRMKGSFSGFIYSPSNEELIIFTDHLATRPIYYFFDQKNSTLIFSSELKVVSNGMKMLGFKSHLDIRGAYCLLVFGFMIGDITLISGIKKLNPGNILIYKGGKLSIEEYYRLSNEPIIESDDKIIMNELDSRFKQAVKLEYEKDAEYGYSHIATLSGGLDSRTNVAYAKISGYANISCLTFSESDYLDEKIARTICRENHFDSFFFPLDNGDYLSKYIDDIININGGMVLYSGSAHVYSCCRKISFWDYGLVHTGMIGDAVLGTYLSNKFHSGINESSLKKIAYSNKLIDKLNDLIDFGSLDYKNEEIFAFYNRGIAMCNGFWMFNQFTDSISPFMYPDFIDYAVKISPKSRHLERIYIKWINEKIPEFSKYKWQRYGLAPRYPLMLLRFNRSFINLLNKFRYGINNRRMSMNPFDYWWKSNKVLREQINHYFRGNINILKNYPDLMKDSNELFKDGTLGEKTQVITLLGALRALDIE